jgi:hypothetical protein
MNSTKKNAEIIEHICTPVSSTNKSDCHDISVAEILLKVALNTLTPSINSHF